MCTPSVTAEATLAGSAAAAPLQRTTGCCRNGTRIIRTQPTVAQASGVQKYKWRCTAGRGHADYEARPDSRSTPGTGCPACAAEQKGKVSHGSLAEQRPDLVAEWDGARNGRPPGQVTCGSGVRAWWRCSQCGHSWQAQVEARALRGTNCPRCHGSNRMKPRMIL